jgi:hypothetical protein
MAGSIEVARDDGDAWPWTNFHPSRDLLRRYRVEIDGKVVGRIWRGGALVREVTPGSHYVRIRMTGIRVRLSGSE